MRRLPLLLLLAAGLALGPADAGAGGRLSAPDGGTVRAVVVGIDLYRNVPSLRGAAADADDLAGALAAAGVDDLTLLKNADADRARVLAAVEGVTTRAGAGDLVILSIAGHGASEPERVKGSKPSGRDEVYLLSGFDTRLPGSRERIFGDEFKALIRALEATGASVLFIADTCHAGGLTRRFDPRSAALTWRKAPAYTIEEDDLAPISTPADAVATDFDFKRLTFMAGADENTKVAEIAVPGLAKPRGALSYAMSRAFEGAADQNGDGRVSRRELFQYVRQTVYQLTDQRQNVVTRSVAPLDAGAVLAFDGAQMVAMATGSAARTDAAAPAAAPIRLASIDGAPLGGLEPALTPFVEAQPKAADLVFDKERGEALAGGDVVAAEVAAEDLPFVVDRMAAVAALKRLSARAPLTVRALPSDVVHARGETVGVEVEDVAGRSLVLFDVTGDGTVQFLHPRKTDGGPEIEPSFSVGFRVRAPYGADTLVAVAADEPMPALLDFLAEADGRRVAGRLPALLPDLLPAGARIGFASLYTAARAPVDPPPPATP